jgi:hypothetical protein
LIEDLLLKNLDLGFQQLFQDEYAITEKLYKGGTGEEVFSFKDFSNNGNNSI